MFVTGLLLLTMLIWNPTHAGATVKQYPRLPQAGRQDRILIVAPHIDDEAIAAGGYAADAVAGGAEVYVVFLTAGDCNRMSARVMHKTFEPTASNYLSVGRTRIAEARSAMKMLGVPEDHYFVLGYPDRGLKAILSDRLSIVRSSGTRQRAVPYAEAMTPGSPYRYASLMADMEQVMKVARPTTVIAPVPFDLHPDHAAAAEITDLMLDGTLDDDLAPPRRLGYLVHSSRIPTSWLSSQARALVPPRRVRALSWTTYPLTLDVQRNKDALLKLYKSQRPYTSIMRNAFIRSNELFFVYAPPAALPVMIPASAQGIAAARLPIAR
jgi:LmbE family N-acetylglucosaminyl deacetylase